MNRAKRMLELGKLQYNHADDAPLVQPSWMTTNNEPESLEADNSDGETDLGSEHSDHNTNSEQSDEDVGSERSEHNKSFEQSDEREGTRHSMSRVHQYIGKDKITKWNAHASRPNVRTPRHNIIADRPGVKGHAKEAKTIRDCWQQFFSQDLIDHIVECTNVWLQSNRANYARARDCRDTDSVEIYALIGLLYMAGVKKAQYLNTKELWSDDGSAPECFRLAMSRERFHLLLRALRFDNPHDRAERKLTDNLAPIRFVFENFVAKCQKNYTVGEFCTVDEMLENFKGRCKFRQYIANKPAKYGLKIYALVDSRMFYTSNMEIYAGRQPDGPYKLDNSASAVVKRISQPVLNSGRNITMDNYFTSIPLAKDLLAMKTTIVGTLRRNKREIPEIFTSVKDRPIRSSMFGFQRNIVLVSYKPKPNKNVLALSTLHSGDKIDPDSGESVKPEIITFYNITKGGVDVVDELKSTYSVSRFCCRWPLRIFFTLLDVGGINSQIIYKSNTDVVEDRRIFLKELARQLIKPYMTNRSSIRELPFRLRTRIREVLGLPVVPETQEQEHHPDFCRFCPRRKNRKTKKHCEKCGIPICTEHTTYVCVNCTEVVDSDHSQE